MTNRLNCLLPNNFCNTMKIKAGLLKLLVAGIKFCKKTDITIIIANNQNIKIFNKSIANK